MTRHRVELRWRDGDRASIVVQEGETILEAAEAADVALPFGCRRGTCATCTGRLLEGRLSHRRQPRALKDRHVDAGYVLTCVGTPERDCAIEVGSDVRADLVTNPWK